MRGHSRAQAGKAAAGCGEGRSAAALVLTAIFGPVGLCYLSVTTGLIATVILVVSNAGAAPLLVLWPLSMVWAVIGTNSLRRAVVGGRRHLEGA